MQKNRKKKQKDAPQRVARRNARGQGEVRAFKTLRGLQDLLQNSACGLSACEESCNKGYARSLCKSYASIQHVAQGCDGFKALRAFRRTTDTQGTSTAGRQFFVRQNGVKIVPEESQNGASSESNAFEATKRHQIAPGSGFSRSPPSFWSFPGTHRESENPSRIDFLLRNAFQTCFFCRFLYR